MPRVERRANVVWEGEVARGRGEVSVSRVLNAEINLHPQLEGA
jgi:hypothetical protein